MVKHSNSGESGSLVSELEKSTSPEICRKWSQLVFKIYERMIHSSEVSFFISSPQIISSLGFILASCDSKGTETLLKYFEFGNEEINMEFVIEQTLKFVHKWSGELRNLVSPGQYHRSRRVYAHPKFVNPHKENTFMFFRLFRVEEKIFEGPKEVQNWTTRTLKTNFSQCQRELNIWEWEQTQIDRMRQQRMAEELSTKVLSNENKSRKNKHHKGVFLKKNHPQANSNGKSIHKETSEEEKKSPILVWTSHVIIEIPDEFFDGKLIYTWNRKEYLKVHESPAVPIRIQSGKFDFNTFVIPTQNSQLIMLIFYGYNLKLCSIESMKSFVTKFCNSKGPSIVRKNEDNDFTTKKSIYFPNWKVKNFPANRIAQHIVASANLHSLFVSGGFGDLAVPDAIPSATGDPKKISHFQHYGLLSFRNSPNENSMRNLREDEIPLLKGKTKDGMGRNKSEIPMNSPIDEPNANEIEMIDYPICVVLWDKNRELPAYMGKVTGELTAEEIEENNLAEKTRKQKKKWCFC